MVDNFDQISRLLDWESEDDFYFVQILKRKKENPELGSNSYVVKTYYIRSLEHLNFYKVEMVNLAKLHNARVYINLNKRSFKKCALQTARKILDQMANNDFDHAHKAFNTVCGKYSAETDKKWVVDLDGTFPEIDDHMEEIYQLKGFINKLMPFTEESKIIDLIPTKNGCHLITRPFNLQDFKEVYKGIDVHKNNPTILYIGD